MKRIICYAIIISALLIPFKARAVDQGTLDLLMGLLHRFEDNTWDDLGLDKETLVDGLTEIYGTAISNSDSDLQICVLYAMGETGYIEFYPILTSALESEPFQACLALGKLRTSEAISAVIPYLDHDTEQARDAAIWALGEFRYYSEFQEAGEEALAALYDRLEVEPVDWLRDEITAAIAKILPQLPPNNPPVCSLSVFPIFYFGLAPAVIHFNASGSYDPDQGDTLSFSWDFNGDGIFGDSYNSGTPSQPVKNYTSDYWGPVLVRVTDNHGASSVCSVTINIDIW